MAFYNFIAARGGIMNILVVDDHLDTARVMSLLLERQGFNVKIATSVSEAMKLLSEPLDLLISDLDLPDGSGLDIMRAISDKRVPGIALSGFAGDEDVQQSTDAGFQMHLTKPVDLPKLLSAIDMIGKK
jgi:CheY-like chemotaxis protein